MALHIKELTEVFRTWRVEMNFTIPAGKQAGVLAWVLAQPKVRDAQVDSTGFYAQVEAGIDGAAIWRAIYDELANWE